MHAYRTHNCAALRASNVGERVKLSGWIHRKRDHGGVLFVDLRDHFGITQIVGRAGTEALKTLDHLRAESVVTIEGEVVARGAEATNANLPTGEIEVVADDLVVIGNGRVVAQGPKADLLATAGTVARARDTAALAVAMEQSGLAFTAHADGSVRTDASPDEVGQAALDAGVALTELRTADGAGLEEMFLELTADTQREGAAA